MIFVVLEGEDFEGGISREFSIKNYVNPPKKGGMKKLQGVTFLSLLPYNKGKSGALDLKKKTIKMITAPQRSESKQTPYFAFPKTKSDLTVYFVNESNSLLPLLPLLALLIDYRFHLYIDCYNYVNLDLGSKIR